MHTLYIRRRLTTTISRGGRAVASVPRPRLGRRWGRGRRRPRREKRRRIGMEMAMRMEPPRMDTKNLPSNSDSPTTTTGLPRKTRPPLPILLPLPRTMATPTLLRAPHTLMDILSDPNHINTQRSSTTHTSHHTRFRANTHICTNDKPEKTKTTRKDT
jgi:hypothetical protein